MAAAPQYGFAKFIGQNTGKTYITHIYLSDVANSEGNFDSGAGASSSSRTWWQPPEPVILVDFAIHTGMTDTTKVRVTKGGQPTASVLVYAAHLDTSNARPALSDGFAPGMAIGFIQLA
jgi:hypothetical protein